MMHTRISLGAVVLAAAALAAGCGGSDDEETSAATAWADGVCSTLTSWQDAVKAAADSLTASGAEDRLQNAVDDVKEATETMADDLKGLGRPDTEAGQEAKDAVDALADDLAADVETIEDALDDTGDVSGALTAVSTLTGTVVTMSESVKTTLAELEELDAQGELRDAFEEAESCQALQS